MPASSSPDTSTRRLAPSCRKRLAPSPRLLLEVALCHEKEGKTATAYAEFNTVVQQAEWEGPKEAAKTAKAHILQLDPRLSRITVKVPPTSETDGLQVIMDGFPLARTAWGLPQPVDPGRHEISASGPGREPWSTTIRILGDKEQQSVQVPTPTSRIASGKAPETVAQKEARAEDPDYGETPVPHDEQPPVRKQPRPLAGYLVAGGGLAVMGVGTYFGLRAIQLRKDSDSYCVKGCSQRGVELNDSAKSAAWGSDIALGLGLVGVGVGAYLLLKPPSGETDRAPEGEAAGVRVLPMLGSAGTGLSVGGAW
jgi:hypothetical protein